MNRSQPLETPLVSIVLTVYNGNKYLRPQLDSILNQKYRKFELIIIDDCSVDSSQEILAEYAASDERISVHLNETNKGAIHTFEVGISKATGDLICLSDQDDIWLPDHVQTLVAGIGDNSLAHTDAFFMYGEKKTKKLFSDNFKWVYGLSDHEKLKYLIHANYIRGANCIFTNELKSYILPFPEHLTMHDHWIAFCAILSGGVKDLSDVTCFYRRHENTVTNEKRFDVQKIMSWDPSRFARSVWAAIEDNHSIKRVLTSEAYFIIFNISNKYMYSLYFILRNYKVLFGNRKILHRPFVLLRLLLFVLLRRIRSIHS